MKNKIYCHLNEWKKEYPFMYADPISEDELSAIESYSGWRLPDEYVELLRFSSGAMVGAFLIYGANPNELMGVSCNTVISVTNDFRCDGWDFGEDFIVISENHAGDPVLLNKNGSVYMPSHDGFGDQRWESFVDFLEWCISD